VVVGSTLDSQSGQTCSFVTGVPPQKTHCRPLPLEAVSDKPSEPKRQKTQPKGKDKRTGRPAEPMEIPVAKREDLERVLARLARRP